MLSQFEEEKNFSGIGPSVSRHKQYLVCAQWYDMYKKHTQGGENPGKIITSSIADLNNELKPGLKEVLDYKVLSEDQWTYLSSVYGAENEIQYKSKRSSFRSVSSGGYNNKTERGDPENIKLPISARKDFENLSWKTQETISKLGSMESLKQNLYIPKPSAKIGLKKFDGSDSINSVLQLLFTVEPLMECVMQNSFSSSSDRSELVMIMSMLCISVVSMHSGIIDASMILKNYIFSGSNPGLMLENIINKLDYELGVNNTLQTEVFNGKLEVQNHCLNCAYSFSYRLKFSYLNLKLSKSLQKSLEIFSRHSTETGYCNQCQVPTYLQKSSRIKDFPWYLLIILKRWEEKTNEKKTLMCSFKKKLVLDQQYSLIAVISDINRTYISFCKRKKGWYKYDNEKYSKVSSETVKSSLAYVLLYKKIIT
jgi:hypothetical protein